LNHERTHNTEEEKYIEKIIETKRVAKVVKGGRNFSFSAIVVMGDREGNIGVGNGKANEIVDAIRKAKDKALKNMFKVPIIKGTIPHEVMARYGASRVMMKPAAAVPVSSQEAQPARSLKQPGSKTSSANPWVQTPPATW